MKALVIGGSAADHGNVRRLLVSSCQTLTRVSVADGTSGTAIGTRCELLAAS